MSCNSRFLISRILIQLSVQLNEVMVKEFCLWAGEIAQSVKSLQDKSKDPG